MQMPGRSYTASSSKYRYGFNGKENDNEIKGEGNQQDYGMRIYHPRVGRFLSVDPLVEEYPELTPYQFASNSPITFIDRDGEEAAFRMPDGSTYIQPPSDHMIVPIPQKVRDNGIPFSRLGWSSSSKKPGANFYNAVVGCFSPTTDNNNVAKYYGDAYFDLGLKSNPDSANTLAARDAVGFV